LVRTLASEVVSDNKAMKKQLADIAVQNERMLNATEVNKATMLEHCFKPVPINPEPHVHESCPEAKPADNDDDEFTLSPKTFKIAFIALAIHFVDYLISSFFAPRLGIKRHVATKA
jgi:hypothetical protein